MEMDIQVASVQALLRDTRLDLDELEKARRLLSEQDHALQDALGVCTGIAEAAGRVCAGVLGRDITAIMTRCNNAVQGVTQAVTEYLQGDEQMVRDTQRLAASLPPNYRTPRYGGPLDLRPVE